MSRYPFCKSLEEIGDMTDEQIDMICGDKPPYAKPKPGDSPEPQAMSYDQVFWSVWRQRGLTDDEIRAKWKSEIEKA